MAYDASVGRALLALARYSVSDDDIGEAKECFTGREVNWVSLLAALFRNKVAGLAYYNAVRFDIPVPHFAREALRLYYAANIERNRIMGEEAQRVRETLVGSGIDVRPLKGTILIPAIYSDLGSRFVNDIDMFISRDQAAEIDRAMSDLGFVQGKPKPDGSFLAHSREERVLWSMKMFNLLPYHLRRASMFAPVISVDFAFGMLFEHTEDVSKELLINEAVIGGQKTLSVHDFFLHLCTHLYKEATMEATIAVGQDLNLIKYVDVREFILLHRLALNSGLLRERAIQLSVQKPVYFALQGVVDLFGGESESDLLKDLGFDFSGDPTLNQVRRQGGRVVSERSRPIVELLTDFGQP
jgi:hypothetical protein